MPNEFWNQVWEALDRSERSCLRLSIASSFCFGLALYSMMKVFHNPLWFVAAVVFYTLDRVLRKKIKKKQQDATDVLRAVRKYVQDQGELLAIQGEAQVTLLELLDQITRDPKILLERNESSPDGDLN